MSIDENICIDMIECLKIHSFKDLLKYLSTELTQDQSVRISKLGHDNIHIGLYPPVKIIDILFFYDCINAIEKLCNLAIQNNNLDFFKWKINIQEYNKSNPNELIVSVNQPNIFSTLISLIFNPRYAIFIKPIKGLLGNLDGNELCSSKITKDSYLYMFHLVIKNRYNPVDTYENLFNKILDKDTKPALVYFIAYYFYYHLYYFMTHNDVPYVTADDYITFLKKLKKTLGPEFYDQFLKIVNQCFEPNYFNSITEPKVSVIMNYLFPKCN